MRYVTDANGKLIGTQDYSAYGAIVSRSGVTSQLGYAGMWQHETSGLNLTWYRPYNPRVGRWLSRDPIGEEGGLNLFGYVEGSPVKNTDPLGLASQCHTGLESLGNLDLGPIYHSYSKYTDSTGVVRRRGLGRDTTNDSWWNKIAGVFGPVGSSIIKGKDNINEIAKCTPDDEDKCMDRCLEESWNETEKNLPKYGWIFGSTCQSVQANIWANCQRQCRKR